MTTMDPHEAVQYGLWKLLRADAQIMALVDEVLDAEPELNARRYPYISVPDMESVPFGTHDDPGRRITARIHTRVKGDVRGQNTRVDNRVGERIMELLDHGHAVLNPYVPDYRVWMIHHKMARTVDEDQRTVRHRVDRLDIYTSNNP